MRTHLHMRTHMRTHLHTRTHMRTHLHACRTYYKFKGKAHSSEHLLRFVNMVCNQNDDKTWALSNGSTSVASSMGAAHAGGVSSLVSNQSSMGLLGGVALVVMAVTGFAVRQRAVQLQQVRTGMLKECWQAQFVCVCLGGRGARCHGCHWLCCAAACSAAAAG
jgi:hypothetical protein